MTAVPCQPEQTQPKTDPVSPPDSPAKSAESPPKDVASILEAKDIPDTKMYFEMAVEGKPVGYHMSALAPSKGDDGGAYDYRAESMETRASGMKINSVVTARLRRNFEPLSIAIDRQLAHPEAAVRRIEDSAQVGEAEISISHRDTVSGNSSHPVPKPKEPFIFGMEFVVEAIDLTKNDTLPIAEFNVREETLAVYRAVRGRATGESQEMVLQKANGGIGYRFAISPTGRIEAWADSGSPIMMKRCTEERFKEVRSAIEGK
jgi:hypothetical protein